MFTLQDMIECFKAGVRYGADEWVSTERGLSFDEPGIKQYFKTKFNINIDDKGK